MSATRTVAFTALLAVAACFGVVLAGSASAHLVEPPTIGTPPTGTLLDMPGQGHTYLCWVPPGTALTNANAPWVHGDSITTSEIPHVEGRVNWAAGTASQPPGPPVISWATVCPRP